MSFTPFTRFLHRSLLIATLSGLTLSLSSCLYERPDDEYLHEIPTTNNPNITRDNGNPMAVPV